MAPLAGAGGQEVEPDWRKGKGRTALEGQVLTEDPSFSLPPSFSLLLLLLPPPSFLLVTSKGGEKKERSRDSREKERWKGRYEKKRGGDTERGIKRETEEKNRY